MTEYLKVKDNILYKAGVRDSIRNLKNLLIDVGNQDNSLNSNEYIVGMITGIQLSIDTLKDRMNK